MHMDIFDNFVCNNILPNLALSQVSRILTNFGNINWDKQVLAIDRQQFCYVVTIFWQLFPSSLSVTVLALANSVPE